jgi:lipopolysaccharide export system protein LptC
MRLRLQYLLLGLIGGVLLGWMWAQQAHERQEAREREAYANDPELVQLRKELALEFQLADVMENLEDDDESES